MNKLCRPVCVACYYPENSRRFPFDQNFRKFRKRTRWNRIFRGKISQNFGYTVRGCRKVPEFGEKRKVENAIPFVQSYLSWAYTAENLHFYLGWGEVFGLVVLSGSVYWKMWFYLVSIFSFQNFKPERAVEWKAPSREKRTESLLEAWKKAGGKGEIRKINDIA